MRSNLINDLSDLRYISELHLACDNPFSEVKSVSYKRNGTKGTLEIEFNKDNEPTIEAEWINRNPQEYPTPEE